MLLLLAFAACACLVELAAGSPIPYASYSEILARLQQLQRSAPDLVTLWNAQDAYGLPSPGDCGGVPCLHWFLTITNRTAGRERELLSNKLEERPQVFVSGNLHGDEKVGPMTLIYFAEHIIRHRIAGDNAWVNELVDTRTTILMPISNPIGYHRNVREENGADPNRDFPYDNSHAQRCMRTVTARAINELYLSHLIQSGITFHGGLHSITYEWGSPNHQEHSSEAPDDRSQAAMTEVFANVAGRFLGKRYDTGRMNNVVYYVEGGLEDWTYASSWDSPVATCRPVSYGGYPEGRTGAAAYAAGQLRGFMFLIEAWDDKAPAEAELGSTEAVEALVVEGPGDGHVPRNERIVYALVDLAAPYVLVTRAELSPAPAGAAWSNLQGGRRLREEEGGASAAAAAAAAAAAIDALPGLIASRAAEALLRPLPAPGSTDREPRSPAELAAADAWRARHERALEEQRRGEAAEGRHAAAVPVPRRTAAAVVGYGARVLGTAPLSGTSPCWRPAPVGGASVGPSGWPFCGRPEAPPHTPGHDHSAPPPYFADADGGAPPPGYAQWLRRTVVGALAAPASAVPDAPGWPRGSPSTAAPPPPPRLSLGWDVGGAVTVDATSALLGAWDVRVPPALLLQRRVADAGNVDPDATDAAKGQAVMQLQGYGLTDPGEAAAFVRCLHAWQLFAEGRITADAVPAACMLLGGHAAPVSGVSRWVFGSLGEQPDPPGSGPTSPAGAPRGSPNLAGAPLLTRFTDCWSVGLVAVAGANRSATAAGACSGPGGAAQPAPLLRDVVSVQAVVVIPYARVDGNWESQGNPTPKVPPQSHVVNARRSATWTAENGGFRIRGRLHAVAEPLFIGVETWWVGSNGGDGSSDTGAGGGDSPSEPSASASVAPAVSASATRVPAIAAAPSPASAEPPGGPVLNPLTRSSVGAVYGAASAVAAVLLVLALLLVRARCNKPVQPQTPPRRAAAAATTAASAAASYRDDVGPEGMGAGDASLAPAAARASTGAGSGSGRGRTRRAAHPRWIAEAPAAEFADGPGGGELSGGESGVREPEET